MGPKNNLEGSKKLSFEEYLEDFGESMKKNIEDRRELSRELSFEQYKNQTVCLDLNDLGLINLSFSEIKRINDSEEDSLSKREKNIKACLPSLAFRVSELRKLGTSQKMLTSREYHTSGPVKSLIDLL